MLTTVCLRFFPRITTRFQPFAGDGASTIANSFVSRLTITGTPGSFPSIVTAASFSSCPDQLMTPDRGPSYVLTAGVAAGGLDTTCGWGGDMGRGGGCSTTAGGPLCRVTV